MADRQAATLAELSVTKAAARLELDWAAPLRQLAFHKAVFRPAVLRAIRTGPDIGIASTLAFHSLRHSWISICASAGIAPEKISRAAAILASARRWTSTRTCSPTITPMRWTSSVLWPGTPAARPKAHSVARCGWRSDLCDGCATECVPDAK